MTAVDNEGFNGVGTLLSTGASVRTGESEERREPVVNSGPGVVRLPIIGSVA